SSPLSVTIDTSAPVAPSTPDMTAATDTGSSNADDITSDTTPTFAGTAEAGSTVTICGGVTQLGTATAAAYASPGITVSALSSGTHSITAKATDTAGNVSSASGALSITIDNTVPTVTIDSASPNPTTAGTTVTWHANENGSFDARVGGTTCATGTSVESGAYGSQPATHGTVIAAGSLAEGANTIRVCVTDAAGNVGSTTVTV